MNVGTIKGIGLAAGIIGSAAAISYAIIKLDRWDQAGVSIDAYVKNNIIGDGDDSWIPRYDHNGDGVLSVNAHSIRGGGVPEYEVAAYGSDDRYMMFSIKNMLTGSHADANDDGQVTSSELTAALRAYDQNSDGHMSDAEIMSIEQPTGMMPARPAADFMIESFIPTE